MENNINDKYCPVCNEEKPYFKYNGSTWYGSCENENCDSKKECSK